jgi:hypothetical protein
VAHDFQAFRRVDADGVKVASWDRGAVRSTMWPLIRAATTSWSVATPSSFRAWATVRPPGNSRLAPSVRVIFIIFRTNKKGIFGGPQGAPRCRLIFRNYSYRLFSPYLSSSDRFYPQSVCIWHNFACMSRKFRPKTRNFMGPRGTEMCGCTKSVLFSAAKHDILPVWQGW